MDQQKQHRRAADRPYREAKLEPSYACWRGRLAFRKSAKKCDSWNGVEGHPTPVDSVRFIFYLLLVSIVTTWPRIVKTTQRTKNKKNTARYFLDPAKCSVAETSSLPNFCRYILLQALVTAVHVRLSTHRTLTLTHVAIFCYLWRSLFSRGKNATHTHRSSKAVWTSKIPSGRVVRSLSSSRLGGSMRRDKRSRRDRLAMQQHGHHMPIDKECQPTNAQTIFGHTATSSPMLDV